MLRRISTFCVFCLAAATLAPATRPSGASHTPAAARQIRIDWSPLEDYYSISGVRIAAEKERDAIGNIRRVRRLDFIAQAKDDFELPPNFVAKLCDEDGIELLVVPLTFHPREFRWKRGERRRGKLYLPPGDDRVKIIKFVDMTEY